MRKRGFELLVFLFVMVFVSTSISALSFTVQSSSCDAGKTVMGLSDLTNAHGELNGQGNYGNFLCSDEAGSTVCNGNNKVIGLSAPTNAHGEIPDATSPQYTSNDVCFDGLRCISTTSTCGTSDGNKDATYHPFGLISLSGDTNAHIGNIGDYNTNICCTSTEIPYSYWENGGQQIEVFNVVLGTTQVNLVLKNTGLSSGTVMFDIEKKGGFPLYLWGDVTSISATVSEIIIGKASTNWLIPSSIGSGTEELRFTAEVDGVTITSSTLTITILDENYCDNIGICGDYNINDCSNDPCDVSEDELSEIGIDCQDDLTNCYCIYDTPESICKAASNTVTIDENGVEVSGEGCVITITEADPDGCADKKIEYKYTNSCDDPVMERTNTLACPAKIQLPFFGFYNFVATMLVIALMYSFMFSHHNKKRK